jgi:hypothetical protein
MPKLTGVILAIDRFAAKPGRQAALSMAVTGYARGET